MGKSFLPCPECGSAAPGAAPQSHYKCSLCGYQWVPPHNGLTSAYLAKINEVEILLESGGKTLLLSGADLPATLGRNLEDFAPLSENKAVSRQHCQLSFEEGQGCFIVTPCKDPPRTFVNEQHVPTGGKQVLKPGDQLTLSGVPLHFKCRYKPITPKEGTKAPVMKDAIDLSRGGVMGSLCLGGDGVLELISGLDANAIALFHKRKDEWFILALQREMLSLNGSSFIEKKLNAGDTLCVGGCIMTYSSKRPQLIPEQGIHSSSIQLKNLTAGYGQKTVLNGISCTIPAGRLTVILGRSGCGKSTLIKILAGQKEQISGEVSAIVGGSNVGDYAKWATDGLALVPQFNVIHTELTVRQSLEYAADLRCPMRERAGKVSKALRETGLSGFEGHLASELSGGQLKRLNIAAELVGRANVLLLDEPTTGLDYATECEIMTLLRQMSRLGRTVVYVTHSLSTIAAADHVIVLDRKNGGTQVVAEGSPLQVRKNAGVKSWEELFSQFSDEEVGEEKSELSVSTRHIGGLFFRYFTIWRNSPITSVCTLLLFPFLLGIMIRMAVSSDGRLGSDRLLFGLVAMFWLGMNESVREIVKEKGIFLHECPRFVSSFCYLKSKTIFFLLLPIPQAILMALPILYLNVNVSDRDALIALGQIKCGLPPVILMMWLAGVIGCLSGLMVSALSLFCRQKGVVVAVLASVLLTLPQILYSDKMLPCGLAKTPEHFYTFTCWHDSAPVAEVLSFFTFSRYLYLPLHADAKGYQWEIIFKVFGFNIGVIVISGLVLLILTWLALELFLSFSRSRQ